MLSAWVPCQGVGQTACACPIARISRSPEQAEASRKETPVDAPVTRPASLLAAGDCQALNYLPQTRFLRHLSARADTHTHITINNDSLCI